MLEEYKSLKSSPGQDEIFSWLVLSRDKSVTSVCAGTRTDSGLAGADTDQEVHRQAGTMVIDAGDDNSDSDAFAFAVAGGAVRDTEAAFHMTATGKKDHATQPALTLEVGSALSHVVVPDRHDLIGALFLVGAWGAVAVHMAQHRQPVVAVGRNLKVNRTESLSFFLGQTVPADLFDSPGQFFGGIERRHRNFIQASMVDDGLVELPGKAPARLVFAVLDKLFLGDFAGDEAIQNVLERR